MNNIKEKAYNFILKNDMFSDTNKVFVAVSGGADSMALLAYMNEYKSRFSVDIGVVHVNHGIRGETADRDEDFVREYCKKHKIEFIAFNASKDGTEIPENASEDWARQLRYNYFKRVMGPGIKIVTAHTLSDQVETVVFRMARGSGIKGLTGIPAVRDGYARPFLCLNRAEIEALVDHYGTSNITDETNLRDDYNRNKIRHHVVPVLKEINPSAEEAFGKMCNRLSNIYRFISKQAEGRLKAYEFKEYYKYSIDAFFDTDDVIVDEMIMQLLGAWSVQSEVIISAVKNYIKQAKNELSGEKLVGAIDLNDYYRIVITTKYITIVEQNSNYNEQMSSIITPGTLERYYTSDMNYGISVQSEIAEDVKHQYEDKFQLCHFADQDKLDLDRCVIRFRRAGDKFKPACKTGGKISKFMQHIPLAERDIVPIIECDGEVIWVWGVGFTDGYAPDADTVAVYKISSFVN